MGMFRDKGLNKLENELFRIRCKFHEDNSYQITNDDIRIFKEVLGRVCPQGRWMSMPNDRHQYYNIVAPHEQLYLIARVLPDRLIHKNEDGSDPIVPDIEANALFISYAMDMIESLMKKIDT